MTAPTDPALPHPPHPFTCLALSVTVPCGSPAAPCHSVSLHRTCSDPMGNMVFPVVHVSSLSAAAAGLFLRYVFGKRLIVAALLSLQAACVFIVNHHDTSPDAVVADPAALSLDPRPLARRRRTVCAGSPAACGPRTSAPFCASPPSAPPRAPEPLLHTFFGWMFFNLLTCEQSHSFRRRD